MISTRIKALFFGWSHGKASSFLWALQGGLEADQGTTQISWKWEGKEERVAQTSTPERLMADVMKYLEHIKPDVFGESTDRTRFKRA